MVDVLAHHDSAGCGEDHLVSHLQEPQNAEVIVRGGRQRFARLTHVAVELGDERLRLLEAVALGLREIDLGAANRFRDPARHRRHELREMPERERLGVWLPLSLLGGHAFEQPSGRRHLLVELWNQILADGHDSWLKEGCGADWWSTLAWAGPRTAGTAESHEWKHE